MRRNEFLTTLGVSAGTVIFAPFLASCSKNNSGLGTEIPIDFTLDLTQAANASLNSDGGSVIKNGVIVVRTTASTYIALSASCTHEGTTVYYDVSRGRFICPNHGANFSATGSGLLGPATRPLTKYNLTLTGTSLRVYS